MSIKLTIAVDGGGSKLISYNDMNDGVITNTLVEKDILVTGVTDTELSTPNLDTDYNFQWFIIDKPGSSTAEIASTSGNLKSISLRNIDKWGTYRLFCVATANYSGSVEQSETNPLKSPESNYINISVQGKNYDLEKPAAGQRDWYTQYRQLVDVVESESITGSLSGSSIDVATITLGGTEITATPAEINILDGVTSTTTELNILDGNTSATSTTLVDADQFIVNDNGQMVQVALSDLQTYINTEIVNDTTPQLGGNLDINSKKITGDLIPSDTDTYDLGSSTFKWDRGFFDRYVQINEDGYLKFQNSSDSNSVFLEHDKDSGLTISMTNEDGTNLEPRLQLSAQSSGTDLPGPRILFNTRTSMANPVDTNLGALDFWKHHTNGTSGVTVKPAKIEVNTLDIKHQSYAGQFDFKVSASGSLAFSAMKIEGDTASNDKAFVDIVTHDGSSEGLKLGGTLVTATAAELNI